MVQDEEGIETVSSVIREMRGGGRNSNEWMLTCCLCVTRGSEVGTTGGQ